MNGNAFGNYTVENFKKFKIKHIHAYHRRKSTRVLANIKCNFLFSKCLLYETNYVFSIVTVKMKQFNLLSIKG